VIPVEARWIVLVAVWLTLRNHQDEDTVIEVMNGLARRRRSRSG